MVVLAAFQALLSRYGAGPHLAVGSPVAGRHREEIEGLIGFFVNTLVLRAPLAGDPPFAELLARVRRTSLGAYAHEDLPFETLVEELAPERSLDRAPFVRVLFSLLGAPLPELELPGAALRGEEVETGAAKFDLALAFWESPRGLEGQWTWARALFDTTTVESLLLRFPQYLRQALEQVARPLQMLERVLDQPAGTDIEVVEQQFHEPTAPDLPVCDHYAGVEPRMTKSLELQAELGPVFDVTLDCEDGAPVGGEDPLAATLRRSRCA